MALLPQLRITDEGRQEVDLILEGLEGDIYRIYRDAAISMRDKADEYFREFQQADEQLWQAVQKGELSRKEYENWRFSHIAQGRYWYEMAGVLASDMTNNNLIASNIIHEHLPDVYAIGRNYGMYGYERYAGMTSFQLYDRWTVERLIRENPKLIPSYKPPDGVDIPKDKRYNETLISSQLTQAILQGERITEIAERLSDRVTGNNRTAAMRIARTAFTSAENGGRMDSYRWLESQGIRTKKTWIATLDHKTRDSHRELDGETVWSDEKFDNDLMYPGDPDGDPAEVYNCRCTLISDIDESMIMRGTRTDGTIDGMTYEEWKHEKSKK